MTSNFKAVDLVFENCEYIRVPKQYIKLVMEDYEKEVHTVNSGDMLMTDECFNSTLIVIKHTFNQSRNLQPGLWDVNADKLTLNSSVDLMERANRNDITQIELVYNDTNDNKLYYPVWAPEDEYNNSWQNNIVNKNGDLLMTITDPKKSKDFNEFYKDLIAAFKDNDDFRYFY